MNKILILVEHPLYPINHGAIIRLVELAKFLSRNGIEVYIIGGRTNKKGLKIFHEITGAEVYTYSLPIIGSGITFAFKRINKLLKLKIFSEY